MVLHVVQRHRLEAAPAERDDYRIARFENRTREPAMSLDAHLDSAALLLGRKQPADDHRILDLVIFEKLGRKVLELDTEIQSGAVAFIVDSQIVRKIGKLARNGLNIRLNYPV